MRWLITVLVLGTLQGVLAEAQQSRKDLGPLEFLVGSCWLGTFPDGKKTDEHCFEWVFDRKFIRDRHVVRGGEAYRGESILGWDSSAKRLGFWYWNSDGITTVGQIQYTTDGIVFPERYTTPDGAVELKAIWTPVGRNSYRVRQLRRARDGWQTLWTMELRRRD